ncbi:MAG: phosphorelay protein [Nitrosopumilaceae archaeon]
MSEEFTKQAILEINKELDDMSNLIKSCQDDDDITNISSEIQKHLHKIKGLAPMIGQTKVGELALLNDKLIKKIIEGKKIQGIFETITQSNKLMKDLMHGTELEIDDLKQSIKTKYAEFLD